MSKFDTVFFDLDGTLCDSIEGISKGIRKALLVCGVNDIKEETIKKMIGIPLSISFKKRFFPNDKALSNKALSEYKDYYNKTGVYESHLYPGIKDLLEQLSKKTRLIIITAKSTELAKKVLKYHKIDSYFETIKGLEYTSYNFSKSKMIEESLIGDSAVMIGDKKADVLAGKNNFIKTIGVVYGYGTFKELKKSAPDYILKSVSDLKDMLL